MSQQPNDGKYVQHEHDIKFVLKKQSDNFERNQHIYENISNGDPS